MAAQLRIAAAGLLSLAVFFSAQVPSARAESRPSYGGTVVASLLGQPVQVDPLRAQTHTDLSVARLLFDALYRVEEGDVVPHLAASMPSAENPLEVRIALRPRVPFHKSGLVSATDVASSLRRVLKSPHAYLLGNVKSVEAGPGEVIISLRKPEPKLALRLSDVRTSITPKGRAPSWRRLRGTGAYRLKALSQEKRELRLVANESHFAGRVYIDELVLRWFEGTKDESRVYERGGSHLSMNGQIAFSGHRPKYRTEVVKTDQETLTYLGFGGLQAITGDSDFRLAVSAALSRAGMKQSSQEPEQIRPSQAVLSSDAAGRTGADLKAAGRLMLALSKRYEAMREGSLKLEILVNRSRPHDSIYAGRVADTLFKFGIKSKITNLDAKTFESKARKGACDLYIGQLALDAPLAGDKIRGAFVAGGRKSALRNLAGLRVEALRRSFEDQVPLIPLFHRGIQLHHRGDVNGVVFDSALRLRFEELFLFGSPVKN